MLLRPAQVVQSVDEVKCKPCLLLCHGAAGAGISCADEPLEQEGASELLHVERTAVRLRTWRHLGGPAGSSSSPHSARLPDGTWLLLVVGASPSSLSSAWLPGRQDPSH